MTIDLDKISKLASLPIHDPLKLAHDLDEIAKHFSILDELPTDDILPTYQVNNLSNITREDKVVDSAPIHKGYFVIDKLINNGQ